MPGTVFGGGSKQPSRDHCLSAFLPFCQMVVGRGGVSAFCNLYRVNAPSRVPHSGAVSLVPWFRGCGAGGGRGRSDRRIQFPGQSATLPTPR